MTVRPAQDIPGPPSNPLYPLPPDYESLTSEGKRRARVNACRLWTLGGGDRLVASTRFFDLYYLHPDPETGFDPLFYDSPPLPTPPFHWALSRQWGNHRLCVAVAPRGSAKSFHIRKDMILRLLSRPGFSFVYATSSHDNARLTGQIVKDQLYFNQRISDDWIPEYGPMRPRRGDRPTGAEYMFLSNGSWLRCLSSESRLRGWRPMRVKIDDAEYDDRVSTSQAIRFGYMERLLFRLAIPMVLRGGSGIEWVGTFVSRRHFLWHAILTDGKGRALDPRFDHWDRLVVRAIVEGPDGKPRSCWPEMWPLTEEEKKSRPELSSSLSLEQMRLIMGSAAFNHEMMARPGESDDRFFRLDLSPEGRHAWWHPDGDPEHIEWIGRDGSRVRRNLKEMASQMHLFITVDTAFTEGPSSDRRVACLMGLSSDNELFVLDLWSDRKPDGVLLTRTLEMAERWRCRRIFVEVVRESYRTFLLFQHTVTTRMTSDLGATIVPAIVPMRPGVMSKAGKISGLELRFEHGLIKMPLWKRGREPQWSRLFDQIEGFNPQASDCGLEHDDELDCVAMSIMAAKTRSPASPPPMGEGGGPTDPVKEIMAGRLYMKDGTPYAAGLPLEEITPEIMASLSTGSRTDIPSSRV